MQFLKDRRVWIGIVVVACAGMIAAAVSTAKADTIPTKQKPVAVAPAAEAVPSWTGLGFDLHGSLVTGSLDLGPVNIGADGQAAGVSAFYNHRFGVLVLGADVGVDKVFGNLDSIVGVDTAWTVGVRAGLLANERTLIYTRAEWLRAQASGGHLDGYGLGAGIEARIAGTPASIALEYMHDWMDKDAFGPGVDVTSDRITTRLKFNFDRDVTKIFNDR